MSLAKQVREGVAWATGARACAQVVEFGIGIALARLLTPEDFGLLEMIVVVTGFLALFGELGFSAALIQRDQVTEQHVSTVFWLNVLTGAVLAGLLALGAPMIAGFYHDARLKPLTWAVAVNFLIAPLNMVQSAMLNRSMNFRALAITELAAVLVSSTVAIALAVNGLGTWSLIGKSLAASTTTTLSLWTVSRWRPSLIFSRAALDDLLKFSANLIGFSTINYWARKSDDLLIGKRLGPTELGIYGRAYSTMMLPISEVSSVLGKVLFPALSRIRADKPAVKQLYLRWIGVVAFITFPIMGLVFASADSLIATLYGEKWRAVGPVLRILCVVGAFQSIGTTVGWIYQSQGRTDWMFRWGLGASALIIGSIVVGVWLGSIRAVAICYAIMTVGILSYPQFAVPGRLIGMRALEVARAVARNAACSALMTAAVYELGTQVLPHVSPWLRLASQLVGGALLYFVLMRWLAPDQVRLVRELLFGDREAAASAD